MLSIVQGRQLLCGRSGRLYHCVSWFCNHPAALPSPARACNNCLSWCPGQYLQEGRVLHCIPSIVVMADFVLSPITALLLYSHHQIPQHPLTLFAGLCKHAMLSVASLEQSEADLRLHACGFGHSHASLCYRSYWAPAEICHACRWTNLTMPGHQNHNPLHAHEHADARQKWRHPSD